MVRLSLYGEVKGFEREQAAEAGRSAYLARRTSLELRGSAFGSLERMPAAVRRPES